MSGKKEKEREKKDLRKALKTCGKAQYSTLGRSFGGANGGGIYRDVFMILESSGVMIDRRGEDKAEP